MLENIADDEDVTSIAPPLYSNEHEPPERSSESPPPYTDDELAHAPSDPIYQPPSSTFVASRLKAPVIIPQRRPGSKTRGFMRAYAPVLADHGIDQDTFLTFLKSLHKASQVSMLSFSRIQSHSLP